MGSVPDCLHRGEAWRVCWANYRIAMTQNQGEGKMGSVPDCLHNSNSRYLDLISHISYAVGVDS